jgi:hypothetical protein
MNKGNQFKHVSIEEPSPGMQPKNLGESAGHNIRPLLYAFYNLRNYDCYLTSEWVSI